MMKATTVALLIYGAAATVAAFWHYPMPAPMPPTPIAVPHNDDAAEVRLCDQEVPILLNSRDMYELLRADSIVRHLNCNIGKRLP
jgi:hypothetical protein